MRKSRGKGEIQSYVLGSLILSEDPPHSGKEGTVYAAQCRFLLHSEAQAARARACRGHCARAGSHAASDSRHVCRAPGTAPAPPPCLLPSKTVPLAGFIPRWTLREKCEEGKSDLRTGPGSARRGEGAQPTCVGSGESHRVHHILPETETGSSLPHHFPAGSSSHISASGLHGARCLTQGRPSHLHSMKERMRTSQAYPVAYFSCGIYIFLREGSAQCSPLQMLDCHQQT